MLRRLWQTSPELITTAALMLVVLAGALVGLVVDPTVITGAPAWLKPAKFAISITIYTVTLAWIFTLLPDWPRTRRIIGWLTTVVMVLEMAIIATQAWRGTTSHFNVGTLVDTVLFSIMGLAIVIQTLSTIAVAVALWRHRFEDAALGWALRLGMSITIVGAITGGLMTRPTTTQLEAARAGARMTIAGAHTVGAPDGGPGLIGTGWSTEHGDVRIPHFIGLHALQVLPLLALLLARRHVPRPVRARLMIIGGVSYAALYVILLVEALRGVPFISPDAATISQLGAWAIATLAAAGLAWLAGTNAAGRAVAI
jgi:energy-converting hydrogenase Eha subunit F